MPSHKRAAAGLVVLLLAAFPGRAARPDDPLAGFDQYARAALTEWLRDYRGRKVVYHGGSTGAVAAMMPEENIGIVVLANRGCGLVYMVMHDIFDRLLGIPRTWTNHDWLVDGEKKPQQDIEAKNARLEAKRARGTAPSLPLNEYVGTYECDLYGKLEIREEAGRYSFRSPGRLSCRPALLKAYSFLCCQEHGVLC